MLQLNEAFCPIQRSRNNILPGWGDCPRSCSVGIWRYQKMPTVDETACVVDVASSFPFEGRIVQECLRRE